jgi:hypothetical protein
MDGPIRRSSLPLKRKEYPETGHEHGSEDPEVQNARAFLGQHTVSTQLASCFGIINILMTVCDLSLLFKGE